VTGLTAEDFALRTLCFLPLQPPQIQKRDRSLSLATIKLLIAELLEKLKAYDSKQY
jgi:hypothetical protein